MDTTVGRPGRAEAEAETGLAYEPPQIRKLGPVTTTTLGFGGSSMDGNNHSQRGYGNDGRGPHGGKKR